MRHIARHGAQHSNTAQRIHLDCLKANQHAMRRAHHSHAECNTIRHREQPNELANFTWIGALYTELGQKGCKFDGVLGRILFHKVQQALTFCG